MNQFYSSLFSVLLFISIGYIAKHIKLLDVDFAKKLFKFLFTIPLPILVFSSFASNPVETKFLALPLVGSIVALSLLLVSYFIGRLLKFDKKTLGTLMTSAGITSTLSFALPFVGTFYGQENTRYLFLYDFGGAIVVWTLVYYLAGRMGNKHGQKVTESLKSFLKNPMLWALIFGITVALSGVVLPPIFKLISQQMGAFTNPLILCGVGIFLNLSFFKDKKNLAKILLGAVVIMGISLGLAYVLTTFFGLTGVVQKVALICALAPSGTLSVAFAAEHGLDTEYASALVASTMFFAILLLPLLIAI
jgi:predicted permease